MRQVERGDGLAASCCFWSNSSDRASSFELHHLHITISDIEWVYDTSLSEVVAPLLFKRGKMRDTRRSKEYPLIVPSILHAQELLRWYTVARMS